MRVTTPEIGAICQSRQGRDKDRYYIISEVLSEESVLVTDGNFKRLASPKKKNVKHLKLLPEKAESIALKLIGGEKVFDTEIYSALKNYNYPKPAEENSDDKK